MKLLAVLILATSLPCFSNTYFIASNGSDTNAGISPSEAWKSIEHLNTQLLKAGDSVLFRCGDTFAGEVIIKNSGNTLQPIVYSMYGNGAMPVITGAVKVSNWKTTKKNELSSAMSNAVFNIYDNNVLQINARFPNTGLLRIDGGKDELSFYDSELTQPNGYWNGATIRFRAFDWEYRTTKVSDYKRQNITITDSSSNLFSAGWGYYFDNKHEELDTCHEWFYDRDKKSLFFIPANKNKLDNIEAVIFSQGMTIEKDIHNITIQNLVIEKFEKSGILAKGDNENITIKNNTIKYINEVGVNIKMGSLNCKVEQNILHYINGRGITALEPENMTISGNTVSKIGNIAGLGLSGVNCMMGIVIENDEQKLRNGYIYKTPNSHIAKNNTIKNNIVDSIGYVGIRMDGAYSVMENNIIKNTMLLLSDGAAFYCWANGKHYTHNNVIRNNIIFNMVGNGIGTPNETHPVANGIYIDNNSYNIKVEGNCVFNSTGSGIQINSDSYNNTVSNNTIYNCNTGISVIEWAKANSTFGNIVDSNLVFAANGTQRCVLLANWKIPSTKNLATFNHNTYVSQLEMYYLVEAFVAEGKQMKVKNEMTLTHWQQLYGFDKDSKSVEYNNPLAIYTKSKLFYNDNSIQEKIINFDAEVYSLEGVKLSSIVLKPFKSQIVIFK